MKTRTLRGGAASAPDAATRLRRVVHQDHQVVTTHEAVFRRALQTFVTATATRGELEQPRPNRLRYLAAAVEPLRTHSAPNASNN